MDDSFEKGLVVYRHNKLSLVGVTGTMQRQLDVLNPSITRVFPNAEIAPIKRDEDRMFLPFFVPNPSQDITLDQYDLQQNSIVGFTLNEPVLIERMKGLAGAIGFIPHKDKNQRAMDEWRLSFEVEKITYERYRVLADALGQPLDAAFGLVRYTNILRMYYGESEKSAMSIAARKLGVTLPF